MIDELKLLDTAIKALVALRDKEDSDTDYQDFLNEHIERLEYKQQEKILEYEKKKEDTENAKMYVVPRNLNEDDWVDDE